MCSSVRGADGAAEPWANDGSVASFSSRGACSRWPSRPSSRKLTRIMPVCERPWRTEFMKQVCPRFRRPVMPGTSPTIRSWAANRAARTAGAASVEGEAVSGITTAGTSSCRRARVRDELGGGVQFKMGAACSSCVEFVCDSARVPRAPARPSPASSTNPRQALNARDKCSSFQR